MRMDRLIAQRLKGVKFMFPDNLPQNPEKIDSDYHTTRYAIYEVVNYDEKDGRIICRDLTDSPPNHRTVSFELDDWRFTHSECISQIEASIQSQLPCTERRVVAIPEDGFQGHESSP